MVKESIPTEMAGVFENILIRASAGTGKTFQLSNRYLNLLASGVDCQEILATTFTKKGAGEILDRIIQRLSRAALSPAHATRLSNELGIPLSQDRAAEVLQKLLRNLHRLEIGTLDSFFNRVARVFSLELGLPPSWDIVDEQQIDMLSRRTIQELLRNQDIVNLLPLVAKGESTRRVASMVRDLVKQMYLIRRESQPEAWDCLEKVETFLSDEEIAEITRQAHDIEFPARAKQLPRHWEEVTSVLVAENWSDVAELKSLQNLLVGNVKYGSAKMLPEMIAILNALIPHCRAWITNRLIKQNLATCELLGKYGERLEVIKADKGQLRFEDVTEKLVEFVSFWETDQFAFRLDHQIRHLLLDEFQDTSPVQWKVIEPFAKNVCQSNDPLRSFFCVGDMKQAIFGWRGGVAEIFDLVERKLEGLDIAEPLSTSYRSSPVVIDFVNDIFTRLDNYQSDSDVINRAVHDWQDWFYVHSTAKEGLSGYVTLEYAADGSRDRTGTDYRARLTRERNENLKVATVERVRKLNESLPKDKTIGVLVPTNQEVGELIFMLQSAGIRASEEGGTPLTDSAAVELVLSALKLADHPGDSIARFHLSHSPLADLFDLEPETIDNQSANRISAVSAAAKLRDRLVQEGYGPTIEKIARTLAPSCTKRELIRLQHLVRLAFANRSDSQRWSMRPIRFVQFVREEVKIADASSARVRVMTIHKSKGLEFDSVVLPLKYLDNGWLGHVPPLIVGRPSPTDDIDTVSRYANIRHRKLLPDSIQEVFEADQERTVRERMCRFYVAVTRAVHSLHVVCSFAHKPHHKSEGGVLLAMLCPDVDKSGARKEGVFLERGDPDWFKVKPAGELDANDGIDTEKIRQYYLQNLTDNLYRPLSRAAKSMRGMARVRPSMLEGGNLVRLSETLVSPDRELALEFGELMHVCFEQIGWLDVGKQVSDTTLRTLLQQRSPGSTQIDAAIKRFRQLLTHQNVEKLLSVSGVREQYVIPDLVATNDASAPNRIEVHTEKRLAVLMEQLEHVDAEHGSMIEGIVDRLVLVYEGGSVVSADIVDFKVDQIDDQNLTQRIQFYRPQLSAYRAAVERMLGLSAHRIATRLVFVQTGHVIHMDSADLTVDHSTDLKLPRKQKVKAPKASRKRRKSESSEIQQTFWSDEENEQ